MFIRNISHFFLLSLLIFSNCLIGQSQDSITPEEISKSIDRFRTFQKNEPYSKLAFTILISPRLQRLYLINGNEIMKEFVISTAKNGLGCEENSLKTPTGMHRIAEKFGDFGPSAGIYKERKFTGEIATIISNKIDVPTDYVTSRIFWLDGLEDKNKNSKSRYIYIHGTHEEGLLGMPASHGCIRLSNADAIELFDYLPENTLVEILDN